MDRRDVAAGIPRGKRVEQLVADARRAGRATGRVERTNVERKAQKLPPRKKPPISDELRFALAVNTDGLRPWEWWEADSAEMYLIGVLKAAWHEGQAEANDEADTASVGEVEHGN